MRVVGLDLRGPHDREREGGHQARARAARGGGPGLAAAGEAEPGLPARRRRPAFSVRRYLLA